MIWFDIPLIIVAVLFFILSWLFGWGLLYFFRYDFRWHRASVVGILSVVSCTGTLVWYLRYGSLAWELIWSLFVVFAAALPGMILVDIELQKDKAKIANEIIRLHIEMYRLQCRIKEQGTFIEAIRTIIIDQSEKTQARIVEEITEILNLKNEAKKFIEHLDCMKSYDN